MGLKNTKSRAANGILSNLQDSVINNDLNVKPEEIKTEIDKEEVKEEIKKAKRSFMLSQDIIDKLDDIKYLARKKGKNMSLSEIVESAIKNYNIE